jgi:hypothetical protein
MADVNEQFESLKNAMGATAEMLRMFYDDCKAQKFNNEQSMRLTLQMLCIMLKAKNAEGELPDKLEII